MKLAVAAVAAVVVLALFTVWLESGNDTKGEIRKELTGFSMLAERINAACKPGYKVVDWSTGDEFDPLPKGVIQVTCGENGQGIETYVVAVAR